MKSPPCPRYDSRPRRSLSPAGPHFGLAALSENPTALRNRVPLLKERGLRGAKTAWAFPKTAWAFLKTAWAFLKTAWAFPKTAWAFPKAPHLFHPGTKQNKTKQQ